MEDIRKENNIYFNPQVTDTLVSLISGGRLPNTMVIEGEKGTGKKVLAKYIASAIVCSQDQKPCGQCNNCKKAMKMIHPDIKIIGNDSKQKTITVDAIRQIRTDANIVPNDAQNKVYIIADSQNMNREAQNALLKLIEEPPAFAYFILTVNSRGMLLETVISRAFILRLKTPTVAQCTQYLSRKYANKQSEELQKTAQRAKGNIGRALEILSDSTYEKIYGYAEDIAKASVEGSEYQLLCKLSLLEKEKDYLKEILLILREIYVDALYLKTGINEEHSVALGVAQGITSLQITQVIDIIDEGVQAVGTNANKSLLLVWLCSAIKDVILK